MRPYLRAANVDWSGLKLDDVKAMNFTDAELETYRLLPGDIVVGEASGSPREVGKPALWNAEIHDCCFQNTLLRVRPGAGVHPQFLLLQLRYEALRGAFAEGARGSGIHHLGAAKLSSWPVVLPPLVEQRKIARILDHMDALRAKRREAIALLDDLAQSIFLDVFGDRSELPYRWPAVQLGSLLDFLTSGSRGWATHYVDTPGSLFLRIQNVRGGELLMDDVAYVNPPDTAEARRTRVKPGDVLLSITADLGRTAVVPVEIGKAYINQHLAILRNSKLNPHFLSAFLSSPIGQERIMRKNRQGVKAGLNFDDVRSLMTPRPPTELQDSFAKSVTAIHYLKGVHKIHLAELDALFASLQHRAFRGELWPEAPSPAA